MASITFLGAAQTVTGSRHLLTTSSGKRVLIDAGLFQGRKELRERNWAPWTAGKLDAVILTHAHIDHTGFLPRLCAQGLVGRVICTEGTRDLAGLLLPDSGHLQEEEAQYANKRGFSKHQPALPLYTAADAEAAVRRLEAFPYGAPVEVVDGVQVTFHRAGHILGSSFLDLRVEGKRVLFSGDVGRRGNPLLADPEDPVQADAMLLECTYGDRTHPPGPAAEALAQQILQAVSRGGPLLIPAFAVGRTQEILFLWRQLESEGRIPRLSLFVDSPMATDATPIYLRHPEDQSDQVRSLLRQKIRPLQPARLQFVRGALESAKLLEREGFFAVIAASGMVTGGRILAHLERHLPDPRTTVLLVGYQAEETRGRRLLDGAPTLKLRGQIVPVRAKVAQMSGFSAHGDYEEIDSWLARAPSPPGRVFLVHGEPAGLQAQKSRLAAKGLKVEAPEPGQEVALA
ncbi:MAG TPA: MBL fold metallo-hydrolase [Myxococcales bacterium]|nr:MBL fold metallo-hydrolase [Myxococcales bacterium]